ncbi:protease inhibitor I42 family protein [Papillibacter cinnamivorans]|uniref:Inhibitor of cysteine peptidase n=1 Tax=Papillibacter cinnamivorans DSM 12816 TaxID=1122930 RepID=A0A1W2C0C7_9FIRM|nr:protease inhibitor I42 family protein [Papillibacter cinnamivorans]SMC78536.1 inhibitor of cysteine peptidase [Papillibacter cinnamivorans DSM 12816]
MKKAMPARLASVLLALAMLLTTQAFAAGSGDAGAGLEAETWQSGTAVYIPVRAVCEALGYTVTWKDDGTAQTVTVAGNGKDIVLDLTNEKVTDGKHSFYVGGDLSGNTTAGPILIHGSRTFIETGLFTELFGLRADYIAATGLAEIGAACVNSITIATQTVSTQTDTLKTTLQYPVISGLEDTAVQDAVNEVFRKAADDAQKEGIDNAAALEPVREEYPDFQNTCETYFNYRVKYNRCGLLSVTLDDYQYAGGAHGSTLRTSYTFDLRTGEQLSLGDLMAEGSGYFSAISKTVRSEIDRRVQAGLLYELEPFQTISDSQDYYLSNSGLTVYFQQYAYFPYAAGIQEFTVGYGELADMLKPDYGFLYNAVTALTSGENNTVTAGSVCSVTLEGNPTTGYGWYVSVNDPEVLWPCSESYAQDESSGEIVGAGGTYTWCFKALKPGKTTLTFRYYRSWEGEDSAIRTAEYTVTVE